MIKKQKLHFVCILIILITFLFIISACFNPLNRNRDFGIVSISLEDVTKKTIIPPLTIDSYLISFSNGPSAKFPVSTTDPTPIFELVVGTWDISVEGKDLEEITIAIGSAVGINIEAGDNDVPIILEPLNVGQGKMDITIFWPTNVPINAVDVALDGVTADPARLTLATNSIQYLNTANAGYYRIVFDLKTGTTLQTRIEEVIHIYGNLDSTAVINLTESDFTAVPEAPTPYESR
jgi:hypothetical protein